jgi:hypothetical protein
MKRLIGFLFIIVSGTSVISCLAKSKMLAGPCDRFTIDGNTISCNGEPVAELRLLRDETLTRGAAMYYYKSKTERWIYPEGGWPIPGKKAADLSEVKEYWDSHGPYFRSNFYRLHVNMSEVEISKTGKHVFFLAGSRFGQIPKNYLIESGKTVVSKVRN